jgi:prepilin-type N-terminal cleavage/methylation domain-containing protein
LDQSGFTLIELLVSMAVLALLLGIMVAMLGATIKGTVFSSHHMDEDAEVRSVFDRMAIDFAHMVIRPDVDYYLKQGIASSVPSSTTSSFYSNSLGQYELGSPDQYKLANKQLATATLPGNDQISFYSQMPGYYSTSGTTNAQGPLSLVSYRINSNSASPNFNSLERLGCGLVWTATSKTSVSSGIDVPIVYLPTYLASIWPQAVDTAKADPNNNYESVGPDVFRFEYYYNLKKSSSSTLTNSLSTTPWDPSLKHTALTGWQDVAGITVTIAVFDSQSRPLITQNQITALALSLGDFDPGNTGTWTSVQLQTLWQTSITNAINANTIPKQFGASIRVYSRTFYFNTPSPQ